jgi:transcriptional regulator with XRE-family HTH domain
MAKERAEPTRDLNTLGKRIERARNELRMTQETLARDAHTTSKAVRKLVQGKKVAERIVLDVCSILGIDPDSNQLGDYSDEDHGNYSLNSLKAYVGQFRAFRRSLLFPKYILRSGFEFSWDRQAKVLRFAEYQKYKSLRNGELVDRSQSGEIFVGNQSGLLHLLTKTNGALRLITLPKYRLMNPDDMTMRGIVLTQARDDSLHRPSAAAILFEKIKVHERDFRNYAKEMNSSDNEYRKIDAELKNIERRVVNFVLAPLENLVAKE